MTVNPLWMLVPWAVFGIAAGLKFWKLTALFRSHLLGVPTKTERFRHALERDWRKDHNIESTHPRIINHLKKR